MSLSINVLLCSSKFFHGSFVPNKIIKMIIPKLGNTLKKKYCVFYVIKKYCILVFSYCILVTCIVTSYVSSTPVSTLWLCKESRDKDS